MHPRLARGPKSLVLVSDDEAALAVVFESSRVSLAGSRVVDLAR